MPHISKKKLDSKVEQELEHYIAKVVRDTGSGTRVKIFDELLTQTEKVMLAKRIGILFLLKKELSPYKISELLGVSPSTAERFERDVARGRYRSTMGWVWRNRKEGSFDRFMESLVSLAFTGKTKSFRRFIDEL
jgi:Trp operon repressor